MFGFFNNAKDFHVNTPNLFLGKSDLSANELGQAIINFGFKSGTLLADEYISRSGIFSNGNISEDDMLLTEIVTKNSGFMQILHVNLVSGALYCYVKVLLKANNDQLQEVEKGMFSSLQSVTQAPGIDIAVVESHKMRTIHFASAIEEQIRAVDPDPSSRLLVRYAYDFYFHNQSIGNPAALISSLEGLGSKYMAMCQNTFHLTRAK
jgi:hypothetical protein